MEAKPRLSKKRKNTYNMNSQKLMIQHQLPVRFSHTKRLFYQTFLTSFKYFVKKVENRL